MGVAKPLLKTRIVHVGPKMGMNPIPILGLPDLEINSGSPRIGMGIAFLVFFSVTHKIGLFSPKIEAIPTPWCTSR